MVSKKDDAGAVHMVSGNGVEKIVSMGHLCGCVLYATWNYVLRTLHVDIEHLVTSGI